jgi:hypothetical protein
MSNLELQNRSMNRTGRLRQRLEADWSSYLSELGFEGTYLTSLSIEDRHYNASFWLADWKAFAYVIPRVSNSDAETLALLKEAEELSREDPQYDVFLFIGRPGAIGEMKLLSPELISKLSVTPRDHKNRWKSALHRLLRMLRIPARRA